MDRTETINILSLCTGYGGLELGLARALQNPMRVVAVEIETYALANLAAKAQEGKLAIEAMWPDIKTFPAEKFRGCFDIILAGYPCQPFSVAGKRKGTNDPRHLWPYIERIIKAIEPVWCFFENVEGHLTLGFPEVYQSLRDLHYSVEAILVSASEIGAPHRRKRLFILAQCISQQGRIYTERRHSSSETRSGSQTMANASTQRLSQPARRELRIISSQVEQTGGCEFGGIHTETTLWPARPGQPQYKWEEPRTVMSRKNSAFLKGYVEKYQTAITERQAKELAYAVDSYGIESVVGKSTHGITNNVDQLRLLGNGVVPEQAEKAYREMMESMENK